MTTLEKIGELDRLIDGMRRHVAGYGRAIALLLDIKSDFGGGLVKVGCCDSDVWGSLNGLEVVAEGFRFNEDDPFYVFDMGYDWSLVGGIMEDFMELMVDDSYKDGWCERLC